MKIKITSKQEREIEVIPPLFWKDKVHNDIYGLLNDQTFVSCWHIGSTSSMKIGAPDVDKVGQVYRDCTPITEKDFFHEYNNIYTSLCLNPVLNEFVEPVEVENGAEDAEQWAHWVNEQAEQQNFNHENNF